MAGAAGERTDPLRVACADGTHVDHDLRLELPQRAEMTIEVGEVTVHVPRRQLELVLPAVEEHHLVTRGGQLADQKWAYEPRSSEDKNPHDAQSRYAR